MNEQRLIYLLEQWRSDSAAPSEVAELSSFISYNEDSELFSGVLSALMERYPATDAELASIDQGTELVDKILSLDRGLHISPVQRARHFWQRSIFRYAAAVVALGVSICLWLLLKKEEVVYNTISTSNGSQYHISLPDGTGVWLNAASSLRYPAVFTGKDRKVEITGEAYFEVAKATAPFKVNVNGRMEIEVLGTTFNINGYDNEATLKATLLEGAIRVVCGTDQMIIRPGEQAEITNKITIIKKVNIRQATAWKDGIFNFNGVHMEEAMRQIERWYNIRVIYEKGIPDIIFSGELTHDVPLNDLLTGLEKMGIHCRLEGRKLIMLP